MNVVLLQPEIAPNVGNIARLCAATRSDLHLVEPFGFRWDDRQLKRAGMDYWEQVRWHRWPDWPTFLGSVQDPARVWLVEGGGARHYTEVGYARDDYVVFGRETAGIPSSLLHQAGDRWIRIPMFHPQARSLNVANCVSIVLYEALRQQGFAGESLGGG